MTSLQEVSIPGKAPGKTKKTELLSCRIPSEIFAAIGEFQRRHNLDFRTEAIIKIVETACVAVGIDISQIVPKTVETGIGKIGGIPQTVGIGAIPQTVAIRIPESTGMVKHKNRELEDEQTFIDKIQFYWRKHSLQETEREDWINGLAEIYKKQGVKIVDKLIEVTGLSRKAIMKYLRNEYVEREEVTPTKPVVKHTSILESREERKIERKLVVEESTESILDDLIWCPDKEEWLHKIKCQLCKTINFNMFRNCQEKRLKNPNDIIFQPTKPKPGYTDAEPDYPDTVTHLQTPPLEQYR